MIYGDLCLSSPGIMCCSSKRSAARSGCCSGFSAGSCGPSGAGGAGPIGIGGPFGCFAPVHLSRYTCEMAFLHLVSQMDISSCLLAHSASHSTLSLPSPSHVGICAGGSDSRTTEKRGAGKRGMGHVMLWSCLRRHPMKICFLRVSVWDDHRHHPPPPPSSLNPYLGGGGGGSHRNQLRRGARVPITLPAEVCWTLYQKCWPLHGRPVLGQHIPVSTKTGTVKINVWNFEHEHEHEHEHCLVLFQDPAWTRGFGAGCRL